MYRLSWPLALLAGLQLLLLTVPASASPFATMLGQAQRRIFDTGGIASAVLPGVVHPSAVRNCSNKSIRVHLTLSNFAISLSEAVVEFEAEPGAQDVVVTWSSFNGPEDLGLLQKPSVNQSDIYVGETYRAPVTSFFTPPSSDVNAGSVDAALGRLFLQARNVLNVETVMLFYRRDVLEQRGIPVPETWDQLLSVSAMLNGTDFNNDTVLDHALCFDIDSSCKSSWLLGAIAASQLQYLGTSQGYLIDPSTLQQLLNTTGFVLALNTWQRLNHYNSPPTSCGFFEQQFASGSCVFTFNWAQTMGHTNRSGQVPYATGRTGVAPAPGSTVVFERSTGLMVPCTRERCPYATPLHATKDQYGGGWVNRAPIRSSSLDRDYLLQTSTGIPLDTFFVDLEAKAMFWALFAVSGPFLLQDLSPLNTPGWNVSINAAYYSSPEFVHDMYTWVGQQRNWTFDPWATPSASEAGPLYMAPALYHGLDLLEAWYFVKVSVWGLMHPNAAADPQVSSPLRMLVGTAASQMTLGLAVDIIMNQMLFKVNIWMYPPSSGALFDNSFNITSYRADLGYLIPPPPAQPSPSPQRPIDIYDDGGPQHLGAGAITGIVVGGIILGVLLALLVYVALRRRYSARCDLLGNVLAPGLGYGLTLMVSDVQNSTWLWEKVQADVMEQALAVHHEVMRSLLKSHRGYETCTEGDSFIIAFHNPVDALNYSLAVQLAMLSAPWPQQLLEGKEELDIAKDVAEVWLCSHEAMSKLTPGPGLGLVPEVIVQGGSTKPAPVKLRNLHKGACITCTCTSRAGQASPTSTPPPSTGQRDQDTEAGKGTVAGGSCNCNVLDSPDLQGAKPLTASPQGEPNVVLDLLDSDAPAAVGINLKAWLARCCPRTAAPIDSAPGASSSSNSSLVFRGLRIRIGLHSGLSDPRQWQLNTVSGRMCCSGAFVSQCKAVGDTGAGGMVVMSFECGRAILQRGVPPGALVLHMGEHRLKGQTQEDTARGAALYLGLPVQLVARLAEFPALRSPAPLSPCILDAPVGSATIAFMHVPGIQALLQWDDVLTREALKVYEEAVSRHLLSYGGYMMELADGSCLAAFTDPGAAIAWALHVQAELLVADWDPRLLEHELAEEVAVMTPSSVPSRHSRWPPHPGGQTSHPLGESTGLEATLAASQGAEDGIPAATPDATHLATLDEASQPEAATHEARQRPRRRSVGFSPELGPRPQAGAQGHGEEASTPGSLQRSSGHDTEIGRTGTHARLSNATTLNRVASYVSNPSVKKKIIMRGLRIKVGADTGAVKFSVSPSTGRMAYFGRVMNRSARISVMATSGQVLCSAETFFAAENSICLQKRPVMGLSMGLHRLKGIPSPMEILRCTLEDTSNTWHRGEEE